MSVTRAVRLLSAQPKVPPRGPVGPATPIVVDNDNCCPLQPEPLLRQLYAAVKKNDVSRVEELLKSPAVDCNEPNWEDNGKVPLFEAVLNHNLAMVRVLLKGGSNVNVRNCQGRNALHLALQDNHFDVHLVASLLDSGCDANVQDHVTGYTPLHLVVRHIARCKSVEERTRVNDVMQMLMSRCDVNKVTHRRSTALHFAMYSSDLTAMKVLLDAGADMDIQNFRGETALMEAIDRRHFEMAACLVEAGCDVTRRNRYQQTALHYAANKNCSVVMTLLMRSNCDVNAMDLNGDTPLHLAAGKGNKDVVCVLMQNPEVDVEVRNMNEKTALQIATESGFSVVAQLIRQGHAVTDTAYVVTSPRSPLASETNCHSDDVIERDVVYRHPEKIVLKPETTENDNCNKQENSVQDSSSETYC